MLRMAMTKILATGSTRLAINRTRLYICETNAIKHKFSHIANDKETGIENYWAVRGVGKRRWRGLPGARGQVNVNVNVNLLPGKSMSRSG